jgi:nitrate reductase gamma subunit
MVSARIALLYLPYLTTLVFAAGLLWRLHRWNRAAGRTPLFPFPARPTARWYHIAVEICLLRGTHAVDGSRFGSWLFHAVLAVLLVGHIRVVVDFPGLWAALMLTPTNVDALANVIGGLAGFVALLAGLFLLARRALLPRLREITRFEDVFTLALVLSVIVSGLAMRLGPSVDLVPVRAYFADLAAGRPRPMPDIPGFALHFLLAQALAVVAPFGKLLHIPGVFPAKAGLYR